MGFKCGIIGLPNIGKSTLFNALSNAEVPMENYPFCTIDPHIGIVEVPDRRLDILEKIYSPGKVIPTTLEFVDIAGLVKGASKGEGLGNKFLSNIQRVDAIIHLIRCFKDDNVAHIDPKLNPRRDFEIVNQEIIQRDLEVINNRIQKIKKQAKTGDEKYKRQLIVLNDIKGILEDKKSAKTYHAHPEEENFINELGLLSNKPLLILGNISEDEATSGQKSEVTKDFEQFALSTGNFFLTLSANLELEMSQLESEERKILMKEWDIREPGVTQLVNAGYVLLNLVTFFTMESEICQAWTVEKNTPAYKAAAVIHSSFEDRFIKAEVRHWKDIEKTKSEILLKENGHIRIEGKSYIIRDGDVVTFRLANG